MFDEKGERLYTTIEAGQILGIRSRSVIDLIRLGRITPAKRVGRMYYIALVILVSAILLPGPGATQ